MQHQEPRTARPPSPTSRTRDAHHDPRSNPRSPIPTTTPTQNRTRAKSTWSV